MCVCCCFFLLVARENFINITFFFGHFLCVFLKGFKRAAAAATAARAACPGRAGQGRARSPLALLLLRKSSRTF